MYGHAICNMDSPSPKSDFPYLDMTCGDLGLGLGLGTWTQTWQLDMLRLVYLSSDLNA